MTGQKLKVKKKHSILGVWSIGNHTLNRISLHKIWVSYGSEYKDYSFIGCSDSRHSYRNVLMFMA